MAGIPGWLLRAAGHDVTIEARTGSGPYGDVYDPPDTARVLVDQKRRLVRDQGGQEVVSETTLRAPLDTVAPPGSRVTLPDGRTSTVITVSRYDGGSLPVPSHLEIALK